MPNLKPALKPKLQSVEEEGRLLIIGWGVLTAAAGITIFSIQPYAPFLPAALFTLVWLFLGLALAAAAVINRLGNQSGEGDPGA